MNEDEMRMTWVRITESLKSERNLKIIDSSH